MTVLVEGHPVGALSAFCYNAGFGFAGFFVLSPNFRQSIYGWLLLQAGLQRMGDRAIGAEADPRCLGIYEKYGLHPHSRTETWRGVATLHHRPWSSGVTRLSPDLLPAVAEYDAKCFGVHRPALVDCWAQLPDSLALAFIEDSVVCGYGMIRKVHRGYRIGPLQADHPEVALALFDALSDFAGGEPVSIDCPGANPAALRMLRSKGLLPISSTIRIFRGTPPADAPDLVYGRMSLALG